MKKKELLQKLKETPNSRMKLSEIQKRRIDLDERELDASDKKNKIKFKHEQTWKVLTEVDHLMKHKEDWRAYPWKSLSFSGNYSFWRDRTPKDEKG